MKSSNVTAYTFFLRVKGKVFFVHSLRTLAKCLQEILFVTNFAVWRYCQEKTVRCISQFSPPT